MNKVTFFDFSTFPFLNQYDEKIRRNLNLNLINALEHNSYQFKTDGVSSEHIDYIGNIIANIQDIDRAIKGEYIYTQGFKKQLDHLFKVQCHLLANEKTADHEFIKLYEEMLQKGSYQNRRSAYYHDLEIKKNDYSTVNIGLVKQVVDNCYNEAMASSILGEEYSLNFSSKFVDLVSPIQQSGELSKKEMIEIKPSHHNRYITWEILGDMLKEVDHLEKIKKLTRIEALNEFKRVQTFKPVVAVTKYIGISTITSFIPGFSEVVEIVSDVVTGAASDATGEILKKPSLRDIGVSVKESKMKSKLADQTIEFISMTMG